MISKAVTKQQAKLAQIEHLRSLLTGRAETDTFPLTVADLAVRAELDPQLVLQLLTSKPLNAEVVVLSKDVGAPLCLKAELPQFSINDQVHRFLVEKVKTSRIASGKAIRGDLSAFLRDAKPPTLVKSLLTADLKQRIAVQTLSPILLSVIEPPLSIAEIAEQLAQAVSAARHQARYPMPKIELANLKFTGATAKQITAATKHPQFADHVAECSIIGGKSTQLSYVLASDVKDAAPQLIVLAIEGAITASYQKKGKTPPKPSAIFPAKKLASALLKKAPQQSQFMAALEQRAADEAIDDEIGFLMLDGAKAYFRFEDVQPGLPKVLQASTPQLPVKQDSDAVVAKSSDITHQHVDQSFATAFDAAFERVDTRSGGRNYVKLVELRQELASISRTEFDSQLRQLRLDGRYAMDSAHGGFVTLTDAERAAGIQEGNSLLIYVSRK